MTGVSQFKEKIDKVLKKKFGVDPNIFFLIFLIKGRKGDRKKTVNLVNFVSPVIYFTCKSRITKKGMLLVFNSPCFKCRPFHCGSLCPCGLC